VIFKNNNVSKEKKNDKCYNFSFYGGKSLTVYSSSHRKRHTQLFTIWGQKCCRKMCL